MHTRCKPGDLAVIVSATHPTNLGGIVRVIAPYCGPGAAHHPSGGPVYWIIDSHQPLTWSLPGKVFQKTSGPALDTQLQPIRGDKPKPARRARRKAPAPIKQATPEVTS